MKNSYLAITVLMTLLLTAFSQWVVCRWLNFYAPHLSLMAVLICALLPERKYIFAVSFIAGTLELVMGGAYPFVIAWYTILGYWIFDQFEHSFKENPIIFFLSLSLGYGADIFLKWFYDFYFLKTFYWPSPAVISINVLHWLAVLILLRWLYLPWLRRTATQRL
jgi:hypothetical protein